MADRHIDRETGDLISLLSFLDTRLKIPDSRMFLRVTEPCEKQGTKSQDYIEEIMPK
jgi:hypothetical protein